MYLKKTNNESSWVNNNPIKILSSFFLIIFISIELILRIFLPSTLIGKNHIYSSNLYYKAYKENNTFITEPSNFDSDFKSVKNIINSIGIRGPEIEDKSTYRVLNLGDSYIQADEVNFENTFGQKLNNDLDIEFISHGIPSWSPTPEFSWLYWNYEKLSLDEVNLFLCVNDFFLIEDKTFSTGDEFYRSRANYSLEFIPISYNINKDSRLKITLKKFYIVKSLLIFRDLIWPQINITDEEALKSFKTFQLAIEYLYLNPNDWTNKKKINILKTLDVVKNMNNFLLDKNIKLNVLFVPNFFYWEDEVTKYRIEYNILDYKIDFKKGIEEFVKYYLSENNINFINLTEKFVDYKKEKSTNLFYEWDGHFNVEGHNLVYEILKEYYQSKNINLPSSIK